MIIIIITIIIIVIINALLYAAIALFGYNDCNGMIVVIKWTIHLQGYLDNSAQGLF